MKNKVKLLIGILLLSFTLTSCYSHTFVIGDGPKSGVTVKETNHFFIYGLVAGKVSDPQKMADGAKDFQITEVQTFVDGFLAALTFGIYTPTTTIVQK